MTLEEVVALHRDFWNWCRANHKDIWDDFMKLNTDNDELLAKVFPR